MEKILWKKNLLAFLKFFHIGGFLFCVLLLNEQEELVYHQQVNYPSRVWYHEVHSSQVCLKAEDALANDCTDVSEKLMAIPNTWALFVLDYFSLSLSLFFLSYFFFLFSSAGRHQISPSFSFLRREYELFWGSEHTLKIEEGSEHTLKIEAESLCSDNMDTPS